MPNIEIDHIESWTWHDTTYTGGVMFFFCPDPAPKSFRDIQLDVSDVSSPFLFISQDYEDDKLLTTKFVIDTDTTNTVTRESGAYNTETIRFKRSSISYLNTTIGIKGSVQPLMFVHYSDNQYARVTISGLNNIDPYIKDGTGDYFLNITKPMIPTETLLSLKTTGYYGTLDSLGLGYYLNGNYQSYLHIRFNPVDSDSNNIKNFYEWLTKNGKIINPDNPYQGIGDNPDDPGQGDFDYSSDDIPIPDLPKTNVTDSGLVSLFAPDEGQLKQLAKFLWSDNFSLDSFKKIFNNPMDCILGLSILPIHLPHGGAKEITVGNIVSTVSCDVCSEQYVKLNCGSFTFSRSRFTGGYLDNAPYTRCYLYLPFIGTQEINIDEFMGATLGVEYHIDILTGAMFCFVTRNSKLLLTYSGNCAENVPLSANDFTSTISSMLSMATVGAGAIATIASAGAAAPTTAGMASSLIGAGAQGASAVMNSKPNVSHSGSLGGGAGAMGQLYPYLIFIAPRPDIPTDQNMYTGFPSNDIVQIKELKDFNVIEAVNLKVEGANDTEMSEIEAILKGGVII